MNDCRRTTKQLGTSVDSVLTMSTTRIQVKAGHCQYLYNPLSIIQVIELVGLASADTVLLTINIDVHPIGDR